MAGYHMPPVESLDLKKLIDLSSAMKSFFGILFSIVFLLLTPSLVLAQLDSQELDEGVILVRSLESLRDLEYQTWQVVAYRYGLSVENITLRIVGYPGKMRLDHPTSLQVHSGRREWSLNDRTLLNPKLANDGRQAAAEFDLKPLLFDLKKNRPLRLELPGVFKELPVPPYLVREWRSLMTYQAG